MSRSRAYLPTGSAVIILSFFPALWSCAPHGLALPPSEQQAIEDLIHRGVPAPDASDATSLDSLDADVAEISADGPINLSHLWELAKRENPRLAAARSGIGIAAGRALQSSLYPNPTVELSSEEVPFGPGVLNEGSTMVSITQPIVFGDRLDAARRAATADQAVSEANVQLVEREVFGEICLLHDRLITIRETSHLYADLAGLAQQTLATAETRFEARAAPETEVTRAQIEVHQIRLVRSRLVKEQAAVARQLSLAIGGAAVDADRLEGALSASPQPLDLSALEHGLLSDHPALRAADREIEAAEARLQSIKAERTPDLDLHAGVGYRGESNEAIYELGVGMTVPLWDDRRGDVLAGRYALMQARQQRKVREMELLSRLAAAHGEYEASRAELTAMREQIVPAAERSFEQTTESYRGGHASFLDVLDAQRTLTEARTTVIELSGEAAAARARITQIIGIPSDFFSAAGGASPPSETRPIINEPRNGAED